MVIGTTYDLSNHVECSGFLIPLWIIKTMYQLNGEIFGRQKSSLDPQTLRLLDTVDASFFNVTLPARCYVQDNIEKRAYTVITVDTLPNEVEAVKKALEQMLEQAQEQKDSG